MRHRAVVGAEMKRTSRRREVVKSIDERNGGGFVFARSLFAFPNLEFDSVADFDLFNSAAGQSRAVAKKTSGSKSSRLIKLKPFSVLT
jgi:hypothetical protein